MISSKNKISKITLLAAMLLSSFAPLFTISTASAMETIFVTSNQKAGRYSGPIYVKLTASNPEAKIWYTCRRDGTPIDLLKYESPILLTKSCALIYFAYVTTELESKIERTDFTIIYSDEVKLETNNSILQLRNTGDTTVDIGGWELIAGTGAITIPPGTTVTPGSLYTVGKVDPASYELKSPEGYIKSQVSVVAPPVVIAPKPIIAKNPKPVVTEPTIPSAAISTETETETDTNSGAVVTTSTPLTPPTETTVPAGETPVVTPTPITQPTTPTTETTPTPAVSDNLNNIKTSASESKNTSSALPIAITIIILAGGALIGKQFQAKNK
ncbi:MAG: hypothetical protein PHU93_01345 [Candidatus Gracilibacteria bacterium]|nr:hypothetical protein [Candidatus Gracilibacteria bacterium]